MKKMKFYRSAMGQFQEFWVSENFNDLNFWSFLRVATISFSNNDIAFPYINFIIFTMGRKNLRKFKSLKIYPEIF